MYKTLSIKSEEKDGVQFEIKSLIDETGDFFGTSFNCIKSENKYDFMWDNTYWLKNELYPLIKIAVEQRINLCDIVPDLFVDIEDDEGNPEMLKEDYFYEDLLSMFDEAFKTGMFTK